MVGKARSRTSKTIGVIGSRLSKAESVNYRTVLDRISAWMRESRQDGGDSPGKDCNLRDMVGRGHGCLESLTVTNAEGLGAKTG